MFSEAYISSGERIRQFICGQSLRSQALQYSTGRAEAWLRPRFNELILILPDHTRIQRDILQP
jgi:hypothetical protein